MATINVKKKPNDTTVSVVNNKTAADVSVVDKLPTPSIDVAKTTIAPNVNAAGSTPAPAPIPSPAPTSPAVTMASAVEKPQATLVNKTTGDRVAVEVGSQKAQELFGQGYTLENKSAQDMVADTVLGNDTTATDTTTQQETTPPPVEPPSLTAQLKEVLNSVNADPIILKAAEDAKIATQAEKDRLEGARQARLAALENQYNNDLRDVETQNNNSMAAVRARLIKLGMNPSDSSFANVEAGEIARADARKAKLASEYQANINLINSDVDAKISAVAMQSIQDDLKAATDAANNLIQQQGVATDIFTVFSGRDQAEKDREQKAQEALINAQTDIAKMAQDQQQAEASMIMENARNGLYDVSDPSTVDMLRSLEMQSPMLQGLSGVASLGLESRLLDMAKKRADIAKTNSSSSGTFKFSTDMKNNLIGAGFTTEDINNIQTNINNGNSIDSIISASNLTPNQDKVLRTLLGSVSIPDDENIKLEISSAVDKDGFLDTTKIKGTQEEVNAKLNRARELGMFDENDAGTKGFFSFLKDSAAFNPFGFGK